MAEKSLAEMKRDLDVALPGAMAVMPEPREEMAGDERRYRWTIYSMDPEDKVGGLVTSLDGEPIAVFSWAPSVKERIAKYLGIPAEA